MDATTRVIGYARLSDTSEASTSIARQIQLIQETAKARGYALTGIEVDDGVSASKARLDRLGLQRVRDALALGRADAVLVWRLDRLARSVGDISTLLDEGLVPISATEAIDASSTMGRAMVEIAQVFAGMESRAIGERVAASVAHLRANGRYAGGTVPYGYATAPNPNGAGRVLVVEEVEAAIVQEAAARVLRGESLYAVVLDFNARAIPTRRGATWSIQAFRQILTSDTTLGRVRHRGALLRDDSGLPLQVWASVLDPEVWHALRVHLKASPIVAPRRRRSRLLSGLAKCAKCGAVLYIKTNGAGVAAYACTQRSNGRECPGVSIGADGLEEYVTARFLAEVGSLAVYDRVDEGPDTAALADVERAIADTLAAMGEDHADVAALAARLVSLKGRRAELRGTAADHSVSLIPSGATFAQAWDGADLVERQNMLATNVAVLVVAKGRRGAHGVDVDRITLIANPAFPRGVERPEDYTEGRLAV